MPDPERYADAIGTAFDELGAATAATAGAGRRR